ncbi:MAG: MarR family transcriptional regulator [Sphingomonadales bacterium]|nr:MAG: MarR family transcriptional regulator [Sphingomonadales bacterium]TNF03431.1 MAG: MarR family transcriptional regulator [Sphingomonadales bacterium]
MNSAGKAEQGARKDELPVISSNLNLHIQMLKLTTLISQPMREWVAKPHDLSIEDIKIMICLGDQGELTGRELSDLLAIQPMAASRAIAALMEKGWLKRKTDRKDRRRRPVSLTPDGLDAYRAIIPSMAALADKLYGSFNGRERDFLYSAITSILNNEMIHS